jgi:hypothetical protein
VEFYCILYGQKQCHIKTVSKQLQLKNILIILVLPGTNTELAQWSRTSGLLSIAFLGTCSNLAKFPWSNSGSIKATKFGSKLVTVILRTVLYGNRITRSKGTMHPSAVNMKGVGSPDMLVPVDQTARRHVQEVRNLGAPLTASNLVSVYLISFSVSIPASCQTACVSTLVQSCTTIGSLTLSLGYSLTLAVLGAH